MAEDPRARLDKAIPTPSYSELEVDYSKAKKGLQWITQCAVDRLCNNNGKGVFFYPACGHDQRYWLEGLSDICDIFIFCDWLPTTISTWPEKGLTLNDRKFKCTESWELRDERLENLGEMTELMRIVSPNRLNGFGYLAQGGPRLRGARYAEFSRASKPARKIHYYHLPAEGISLYLNLFTKRNVAPEVLCVKNSGGGLGCGWTWFDDPNEPLGRIILGADNVKPTYLTGANGLKWSYNPPVKLPGV